MPIYSISLQLPGTGTVSAIGSRSRYLAKPGTWIFLDRLLLEEYPTPLHSSMDHSLGCCVSTVVTCDDVTLGVGIYRHGTCPERVDESAGGGGAAAADGNGGDGAVLVRVAVEVDRIHTHSRHRTRSACHIGKPFFRLVSLRCVALRGAGRHDSFCPGRPTRSCPFWLHRPRLIMLLN